MKDSKRIDNKAKSRRIAAYALAGCMAVTAAPITMPNMGAEVVEAATVYNLDKLQIGTPVDLTVQNDIKYNTTFENAAKQLWVDATQTIDTVEKTGLWASKASKVEIYDKDDNLIWDSEGNTSVSGTTKFGYGKTYKIAATFKRTIGLSTGTSGAQGDIAVDASEYTIVDGDTIKIEKTVSNDSRWSDRFYPASGIFLSEAENDNHYLYVDKNGSQSTKTGVYKNEEGWFLVVNGTTLTTPARVAASPTNKITETIEKNANGSWYIGTDGKVDFTKTGIVSANLTVDSDGNGTHDQTYTGLSGGKYYVENGKVNYNKTGLVYENGTYYKVVKGKVATSSTGKADVCKIADGKWVYINASGESDLTFNGLAKNTNGMWYIENGMVDFTKDGPVYLNSGNDRVDSTPSASSRGFFVMDGKVQQDKSGVVFYDGDAYFLENGRLKAADFDKKTLAKDVKTGVWYVLNPAGGTAWSYEGLVENEYGTWYVKNGKVDFTKTGLVTDDDDDTNSSYYVENGKLQTGKNGVVLENGRAFNLKAGVVKGLDINKSVVKAPNSKWYVLNEDGESVWYRTIAANANGIWISDTDGTVDFDARGFHEVTEAESQITGLTEGDYVYFKDGKAQTDVNGLVIVNKMNIWSSLGISDGETAYLKNGVYSTELDIKEPTVIKAADGKWYYADEDGIQNKTCVASNQYGTWFVENGKVNFNFTGYFTDTDAEKTYYFVNSKLATDKTGVIKDRAYRAGIAVNNVEKGVVTGKKSGDNVVKANDGLWYLIDDKGSNISVDKDGNTINVATNSNGTWFIKNGVVDFTKTGIVTITSSADEKISAGAELYFVKGKLQSDFTGFVIDGANKVYVEKGVVSENTKPELMKATDGNWYYVEDGNIKTDYTGLAKNSNGIWYVVAGKVSFAKTGVIFTPDVEDANLERGRYYVANGKMTGDKEGIFKDDAGAEYYVKKSAVVTGTKADESVITVDSKKYCINEDGKVSQPACKLAADKDGIWYIDANGRVDLTVTDLVTIADTTELTDLKKIGVGKQVYIAGGKFQKDVTTVYVKNTTRKYVKEGVVKTDDTTITKNTAMQGTDGKWYAVQPGNTYSNAILEEGLADKDGDVVYVNNYNVKTSASQVVEITTSMTSSLAVINNVSPSASVYVAIVDGKMAKDKTGFINIKVPTGASTFTTEKVYVKNGICTGSGNATYDLIKDGDKYYYVGTDDDGTTNWKVKVASTDVLATPDGTNYYLVTAGDNQVRIVDKVNYYSAGTVYTITNGKAAKVNPANATVLSTCNDASYLVNPDGTVDTTANNAVYKVNGVDWYLVGGKVTAMNTTASDREEDTWTVAAGDTTTNSGKTFLIGADGKPITGAAGVVKTGDSSWQYVDANGEVVAGYATVVTTTGYTYDFASEIGTVTTRTPR